MKSHRFCGDIWDRNALGECFFPPGALLEVQVDNSGARSRVVCIHPLLAVMLWLVAGLQPVPGTAV